MSIGSLSRSLQWRKETNRLELDGCGGRNDPGDAGGGTVITIYYMKIINFK